METFKTILKGIGIAFGVMVLTTFILSLFDTKIMEPAYEAVDERKNYIKLK